MVINGKTIDFKITRKSDAANFQKAINNMSATEKNIQKMNQDDLGEVLEALCKMVTDFFITATGIDVVDGCEDVAEINEMYYDFLAETEKQKKSFNFSYSPKRIK